MVLVPSEFWINGAGGPSTGLKFGTRLSVQEGNSARINVNTENGKEYLDIWGSAGSLLYNTRSIRMYAEGGLKVYGNMSIEGNLEQKMFV